MIVEDLNNGGGAVATVNFSVPDEVRDDFNRTFAGRNKSAILADLMRRAVAEARLKDDRLAIFEALTAERDRHPPVHQRQLARARRRGRP